MTNESDILDALGGGGNTTPTPSPSGQVETKESFLSSFTDETEKTVAGKLYDQFSGNGVTSEQIRTAIAKGVENIPTDIHTVMKETMLISNAQSTLSSIQDTNDYDFLVVGMLPKGVYESEKVQIDVYGAIAKQESGRISYVPAKVRLVYDNNEKALRMLRKIKVNHHYNIFVKTGANFAEQFERATSTEPVLMYGSDITDFENGERVTNDYLTTLKEVYGIDYAITVENGCGTSEIKSGNIGGVQRDWVSKDDLKLLVLLAQDIPNPTANGITARIGGTTFVSNEKVSALVPNVVEFANYDPTEHAVVVLGSIRNSRNAEYDNFTMNGIGLMPIPLSKVSTILTSMGV